jgi:excisionase family DNA binding protein
LKTELEEKYPVYLTTGAVARHCGVSKVTVLRWIEKGYLTAFRLPGGQNRIHRDDFSEFLARYSMPGQHRHQETNKPDSSNCHQAKTATRR